MNPIIAILLMAGVTYLIRVIPLALISGKIASSFVRRFLYFLPYTILTAMIVPEVFTSTTDYMASTLAGVATAIVLGWFEKSLITVTLGAVFVAYGVEFFIR